MTNPAAEFEQEIDEVAKDLLAFAASRCPAPAGFDSLLFALAAAQVIGGCFSLLPPGVALDALKLTQHRLGESYVAGKRVGEVN